MFTNNLISVNRIGGWILTEAIEVGLRGCLGRHLECLVLIDLTPDMLVRLSVFKEVSVAVTEVMTLTESLHHLKPVTEPPIPRHGNGLPIVGLHLYLIHCWPTDGTVRCYNSSHGELFLCQHKLLSQTLQLGNWVVTLMYTVSINVHVDTQVNYCQELQ